VAQYLWSSSPLRRYVDFINQRQIISLLREEVPFYARNDTALFTVMSNFDSAYTIYNEFQRNMERYWCLRWLLQEKAAKEALSPTSPALRAREQTNRYADLPLMRWCCAKTW